MTEDRANIGRLMYVAAVAAGAGLLAVGTGMIALSFAAYVSLGRWLVEGLAGATVGGGGLTLLRSALHGEPRSKAAGLVGELALLGSLFYLGMALPAFNQGAVGRPVATLQFITVILAIVIGTASIALTPRPKHNFAGRPHLGQIVLSPDGVVLVAGTILLGIGLGQLANPALMPPKWNWISFLGLTVPGMIVLVVVRGAAKKLGPTERTLGWRTQGLWILLGYQVLLVVGLSLMMYGALNNLALGANGFRTGFKGNGGGLLLWAGAAAFLVFVRGLLSRAAIRHRERRWYAVGRELVYVVGALAFIVGERSMITGKAPSLAVGGAFPAAALIILAAAVLLVPIRLATKPDALGRPEPRVGEGTAATGVTRMAHR